MRILDASATLELLLSRPGADRISDEMIDHPPAVFAHGIELAVIDVLRHFRRQGQISDDRARQALDSLSRLMEARVPLPDLSYLAPRIWQLSQRLTAEAAATIAAAEHLGAPLLTCDPALESVETSATVLLVG